MIYCSNCGNKLDSNSKFCKKCGTNVEKSKKETKKEIPPTINETKSGINIWIVIGVIVIIILIIFIINRETQGNQREIEKLETKLENQQCQQQCLNIFNSEGTCKERLESRVRQGIFDSNDKFSCTGYKSGASCMCSCQCGSLISDFTT